MKKIISFLLLILFILVNQPVFATVAMYKVYNTNKAQLSNIIYQALINKNFSVQKRDPYKATKDGDEVVILLQTDGSDIYYYLNQTSNSKTLNKYILKSLNGRQYEEISDSNYLSIMETSANLVKSGQTKTYNFEETPVFQTTEPAQTASNEEENVFRGYVGKTGKGSILNVYLQNPINTATVLAGDKIAGVLQNDWKTNNGYLIAGQGSVLEGEVTSATPARRGMRNARVSFEFNKLLTPNGQVYNLSTKSIDFVVDNDGNLVKISKRVLASAATGALVGAAFGALSMLLGDNTGAAIWKGAAIGAGIGGVSSGISMAAEKGLDVEIPAFTEVEVEISKDIDVSYSY